MHAADHGTRRVVLITGASGLIGQRLAARLAPHYRVVGLDVRPMDEVPDEVAFIPADLTDDASVEEALTQVGQKFGTDLASVFHLAAYYDFSGEPSPLYNELTVEGTRRILQGLRRFRCEQFVFSSSLLVMRPSPDGAISEESPTQAEWAYPESKLRAEQVVREHRGHIPAVIARIAGVYDEWCRSLPIAQHVRRIYERQFESYLFPGDATHGQAFVHMDDLLDCLHRMVGLRSKLSTEVEVFLVAEPDVVSYGEMQDLLGELIHGTEWPTLRVPKAMARAGAWIREHLPGTEEQPFIKPWMVDLADQNYVVDCSYARNVLGWDPRHRLRTTLPEMIRRLHENPRQWYEFNKLPTRDLPAGV